MKNIERYFLDVISGREKGLKAGSLRKLLFALSKVYGLAVRLRIYLYKWGILRRKTLGCIIISVGNITVGGTGKTPHVEMLARALTEGKRKVAVLSRGYKRKKRYSLKNIFSKEWWTSVPLVVSDGREILMSSKEAGDEPYMLANMLPGVIVLVGKNRVKSGSYAIEKLGVDTLILDDGYQYLPLNRRLNVMLIDATNPFGNGHLLPRGILRESLKHLSRADMFVITKSEDTDTEKIKALLKEKNSPAGIIESYYDPLRLVEIRSGEKKELGFLAGKRALVMTAIADPEGFEKLVRKLGADIADVRRFEDHHRYSWREVDGIIKETHKKADLIITTEKDSVRFPILENPLMPVYYLKVEVKIKSGERDLNDNIARLCNI
ncbi:tetraacyldisaccharide 4'-kinase [Candidatus Auribacterota bacterium]